MKGCLFNKLKMSWQGLCKFECAFSKPSKMGKECAKLIINFRPSIELEMKSMFHEMWIII